MYTTHAQGATADLSAGEFHYLRETLAGTSGAPQTNAQPVTQPNPASMSSRTSPTPAANTVAGVVSGHMTGTTVRLGRPLPVPALDDDDDDSDIPPLTDLSDSDFPEDDYFDTNSLQEPVLSEQEALEAEADAFAREVLEAHRSQLAARGSGNVPPSVWERHTATMQSSSATTAHSSCRTPELMSASSSTAVAAPHQPQPDNLAARACSSTVAAQAAVGQAPMPAAVIPGQLDAPSCAAGLTSQKCTAADIQCFNPFPDGIITSDDEDDAADNVAVTSSQSTTPSVAATATVAATARSGVHADHKVTDVSCLGGKLTHPASSPTSSIGVDAAASCEVAGAKPEQATGPYSCSDEVMAPVPPAAPAGSNIANVSQSLSSTEQQAADVISEEVPSLCAGSDSDSEMMAEDGFNNANTAMAATETGSLPDLIPGDLSSDDELDSVHNSSSLPSLVDAASDDSDTEFCSPMAEHPGVGDGSGDDIDCPSLLSANSSHDDVSELEDQHEHAEQEGSVPGLTRGVRPIPLPGHRVPTDGGGRQEYHGTDEYDSDFDHVYEEDDGEYEDEDEQEEEEEDVHDPMLGGFLNHVWGPQGALLGPGFALNMLMQQAILEDDMRHRAPPQFSNQFESTAHARSGGMAVRQRRRLRVRARSNPATAAPSGSTDTPAAGMSILADSAVAPASTGMVFTSLPASQPALLQSSAAPEAAAAPNGLAPSAAVSATALGFTPRPLQPLSNDHFETASRSERAAKKHRHSGEQCATTMQNGLQQDEDEVVNDGSDAGGSDGGGVVSDAWETASSDTAEELLPLPLLPLPLPPSLWQQYLSAATAQLHSSSHPTREVLLVEVCSAAGAIAATPATASNGDATTQQPAPFSRPRRNAVFHPAGLGPALLTRPQAATAATAASGTKPTVAAFSLPVTKPPPCVVSAVVKDLLRNAGFVKDVISELPGVDSSADCVVQVLQHLTRCY